MTDRPSDFHREQVKAELRQIPAEKWPAKVWRTVFGLAFAAAGPAIHLWVIDISPWMVLGFVFVGAVTASGTLMMAPVRFLIAAVKDLLAAIRAK